MRAHMLPFHMPSISRAIRFEVTFPGWRRADLVGPRGLWKRLWAMSDDLTRAANRLVSALWQAKIGAVTSDVAPRTLAYQGLSGKWQPFGKPLYAPSTERAGSRVLLDTAGTVFDRLETDFRDIQRGKKALPTFRSLPIGAVGQAVSVRPNGDVDLSLFAGRKGGVTVAPVRGIDTGTRAVLTGLAAGTHKLGNARLAWDQPEGRKGHWMLSITWTGAVKAAEGNVIAGVDIGIRTAATVACVDVETGRHLAKKDIVRLPGNVIRGWRRLECARRERGQSNRRVYALREGRGQDRKLRAFRALSTKHMNLSGSGVSDVAAAVVAAAKRRGAVGVALEALTGWSVAHALDDLPNGTNADRARRRSWYFRWHQGALRQRIAEVAEREGLRVFVVEARNSSRTCAACGIVYPSVTPKTGGEYGYVAWDRFVCACGWGRETVVDEKRRGRVHGEWNAALVLAQRGRAMLAAKAAQP